MFRKVIVFLAVLFGTMTCTLGLVSPASALEAGDIVIQVKPAEQEIDLRPDEPYKGSIEVANIGRLAFSFTASTRPYQVLNDDYDPDFSTENDYTKLANWISFSQPEYRLEPGESIKVEFTVNPPNDIPGGGQYAAIIIETEDSKDEKATMQAISQVASLVYAHVEGDGRLSGSLISQKLPSFLLGSPFMSTVTVKNDGNIDFRFEHTLTIYDFFTGREVFSPDAVNAEGRLISTAQPIVLPGTSRTNSLTWEGAPQLGLFRAVDQVNLLGKNITNEQIVFLCPVWLAGIVIFFVILMVLWIILRIRRRKQARPQVV